MYKKLAMIVCIAAYSTLAPQGHKKFPDLVFHQTKETLNKITEIIANKQKGAYLRFGDGDIELAWGKSEMLQQAHARLSIEMREALKLTGPTILKSLPLCCKKLGGFEHGMFYLNHEAEYKWCCAILRNAASLWGSAIRDVYSPVALHFASTQYPEICIQFLKFLRNSNCCMFIGNKNVPTNIRELLFGKGCIFIPTPPTQSYNEIDRIEQECLSKFPQNNSYKVIVTAMGCSGRPLQKRLWEKLDNVFLFDFGSALDALCGWTTRDWIKLTKFDAESLLSKLAE